MKTRRKYFIIKTNQKIKPILLEIFNSFGPLKDFDFFKIGNPRKLIQGYYRTLKLEKKGAKITLEVPIEVEHRLESFWKLLTNEMDEELLIRRNF